MNETLAAVIPDYFSFGERDHVAVGAQLEGIKSWRRTAQQVVDDIPCTLVVAPTGPAKYPQRYLSATKISVCRNPYDLLVSYYCHDWDCAGAPASADLGDHPMGWDNINAIHGIRDFDGFIKRYCDPDFKWHHVHRQRHLFYQMYDASGSCGIDIIMRNERLHEAISTFLVSMDYCTVDEMKVHDRRVNTSPGKTRDYRSYYTDELMDLVTEKCAKELRDYAYDFDGPTDADAFLENSRELYYNFA